MDFVAAGAQAYHQGPISPESWKRAVYRSAPEHFYVGVLPPEKQGGSYSYGLRISPIRDDNASISTRSTSSKGSHLEYDIWRKWEDCLWFQDALEAEYALMAREKRTRLAAGKGVKKDGMYIQSDQAASFESLPPGPDPHSIARDIHKHIPKLTKKGTLFRASQATIDQRHNEFCAMINAFFQEELPMLIKDLMATRTFTDFFGFWRRDHDRSVKAQKALAAPTKAPRRSVSSSMLSSYFSASTPVLSDAIPSSASVIGSFKQPPRRDSNTSDSLSSENSLKDQRTPRPRVNGYPTPLMISSPSRSSKSTISSLSSASISPSSASPQRSSGRKPMVVTHEAPFTFGHNPQYTPDGYASDRPTLGPLPEDREIEIGKAITSDYRQTRRRAGSIASGASGPPRSPSDVLDFADVLSDGSSARSTRYARCSWQTTSSVSSSRAAAYLAELDVNLTLPHPHPERAHHPRASMCSMASYRTDSSADAIIPQPSATLIPQSAGTRQFRHSTSFPEEEVWAEHEPWTDESAYGEDDLLDAYFTDAIPPSPFNGSETPTGDSYVHLQRHDSYPKLAYTRRSSLATSISSGSTGSSDESAIAIKAMYENSIIIIRIPRSLSFTEVRQRLYDKFVRQEGVPLSETFVVALLVPAPQLSGARPHAGSLWSIGAADKDSAVLQFVKSNDDWDQAIYKYGNKVLLRVIGSRA